MLIFIMNVVTIIRPEMGVFKWLNQDSWLSSPSGYEVSGLLVALMLLPAPSLTSNTGRETGVGLETGFFGTEGGAGSFKEPLAGAGPFRSTLAFSLSTEAGVRTCTETNRSIQKGPERTTQPKKASDKGETTIVVDENNEYGTIRTSAG